MQKGISYHNVVQCSITFCQFAKMAQTDKIEYKNVGEI